MSSEKADIPIAKVPAFTGVRISFPAMIFIGLLVLGGGIAAVIVGLTIGLDWPIWKPITIGLSFVFLTLTGCVTVIASKGIASIAQMKGEFNHQTAALDVNTGEIEYRLNEKVQLLSDEVKSISAELKNVSNAMQLMDKNVLDRSSAVKHEIVVQSEELDEQRIRLGQLDTDIKEVLGKVDQLTDWLKSAQAQIDQAVTLASEADLKIVEEAKKQEATLISVRDAVRNGRFGPAFQKSTLFDPEVDLIEPLSRSIPEKTAIDIGTNRGEFTASLRRHGFVVYAFEPNPELLPDLKLRFEDDPSVYIFEYAAGDKDGVMELRIASTKISGLDNTLFGSLIDHPSIDNLSFERSVHVPVITVNSAFNLEEPRKFGILKIDTEGFDLSVLAGASLVDADALLVEFWDTAHPFNQGKVNNTLADYEAAIDRNRYPFCTLMWRGIGDDEFGLVADPKDTPTGSWGSILYLKDESTYKSVLRYATKIYGLDRVGNPETQQLSESKEIQ